jgi:predicted transcriptional regulator YdeE
MKPKIIEMESLSLLGMNFYGDPFKNNNFWDEENEIGHLWNRFINYFKNNQKGFKRRIKTDVSLEIFIPSDDYKTHGVCEIFVGVIVDKLDIIPINCVAKKLPKCRYAVFTLKGEKINSDWQNKIFSEWLPQSEYELQYDFNIQYYDKRFKGIDQLNNSEIDVYLPIIKKV